MSFLQRSSRSTTFRWSRAAVGAATIMVGTLLASPAGATSGVTNWKSVASGANHTCAIRDSDSKLFCWGDNSRGQLGIGNTTDKLVPTQVGNSQWNRITAGYDFTCGIRSDNKRLCWGWNDVGQLGINNTTDQTSPTQRAGETWNWYSLYGGGDYGCGILLNGSGPGTAKCWGANYEGALGTGNNTDYLVPTNVVMSQVTPSGTVFKHMSLSLAQGTRATCGITNQSPSKRYCWGYIGGSGDIGPTGLPLSFDLNGDAEIPQPLMNDSPSGNENYSTVTVGGWQACGVTASGHPSGAGRLMCWGRNQFGELGDGTTTHRQLPVLVLGGITDWAEVTGGGIGWPDFTCAKRSTGMGYCWGSATIAHPDQIYPQFDLDQQWSNIQAGRVHVCGITAAKKLMCWGENTQGWLGTGNTAAKLEPTYVVDP